MALTDVYVQIYGQLGDFFAKLQQGQSLSDLLCNLTPSMQPVGISDFS